LSKNLGASTSWNPQDLLRPVMGLLSLLLYFKTLCNLDKLYSKKKTLTYASETSTIIKRDTKHF
jgi:hypothetical protein